MRKILYLFVCATAFFLSVSSCKEKSDKVVKIVAEDSLVQESDTALYGVCGPNTSMNVLELITDDGETLSLLIDDQDTLSVHGGLLVGDRFTVTYRKGEDNNVVTKAVNLTSLLGRWTSLDRNFVIEEDGSVKSSVKAESKPYTSWSMVNARLILNADTFDVCSLGADSLSIENDKGIFVYKRQR